jgi:hypothetical protein
MENIILQIQILIDTWVDGRLYTSTLVQRIQEVLNSAKSEVNQNGELVSTNREISQ